MEYSGLPEVLKTGSNELELVNFRIFEDRPEGLYAWNFGVNVAKVREVLRMPPVTRLPNVPPAVEGLAEVRGEMIPVVSLARWMGLHEPPERKKYLLHLEFLREHVGIVVHDARKIVRVSWQEVRRAPEGLNQLLRGRITGIVDVEDGTILVLDLEGIVSDIGILKVFGMEEVSEGSKSEGHYTVLVVEDSSVAMKIIKDILEGAGHKVIPCEDGEEAWEKLTQLLEKAQREGKNIREYLQVIFTDIEMPRMDGLTLTKKIKETPGLMHLPVIVNTTLSDEANREKAFLVGADAYLVKFDAREMIQLVEKLGRGS
ncbi:response regulator receiver modulated CheW protein [Thermocrinis albus DSM 14484]|uniref:Response regulator receiver modulated CheW protein n=1 Tax=Thermocrinis albus (strain DSM 14484 / JCM 11386 / HI 11/12) TaxID=638303 RepID=D3SPQ8_THEAH|nr:chemotaxis protein [Thermocrinis albus]ADC89145.1 response regulator receiver modulated CheW protein [Thermocrinis albus DSM 14484]